ncbi:MAG: hypothetical protein ACXV2C_04390 [Candidatus Bathyarchaeia archaeon]
MAEITSRNPFFNNFSSFQEQQLLENLIVESHSIYAPQMYYLPRTLINLDQIYTADDQSQYNYAILMPIYIENFDRFQGDGNFMSKFNLEIKNQIQLSVAMRTFTEEVKPYSQQVRPNEGDLIFFPQNQHCFIIRYVEKFEMFYPLGKLYVWQMTCELFDYSNEQINTGIDMIDNLQRTLSTNVIDYAILTEDGFYLTDENDNFIVMEQYELDTILGTGTNEDFEKEADQFIDFSIQDPFSEGHLTDV